MSDTSDETMYAKYPYEFGFGRLREVVRQFLDGEITRQHLARRHAEITSAVKGDES